MTWEKGVVTLWGQVSGEWDESRTSRDVHMFHQAATSRSEIEEEGKQQTVKTFDR